MKRILYISVIGLSAFLLFVVEPMIAKIILPEFGGGSTVWIMALIFFQGALFFGYAASNGLARRAGPRFRFGFYAAALLLCAAFLPVRARLVSTGLGPGLDVLALLAVSIGLPYLVLSTTSPMVQYFLAVDRKSAFSNPYVQYAVSNLGSFAGLICYPLVIEPYLPNSRQETWWSVGFGLYAVLMLAAAAMHGFSRAGGEAPAVPAADAGPGEPPTAAARAGWLTKAAVPSAALLAFTQYLTVDIVSFPLLWILPLCLYLLSFVAAFLFPRLNRHSTARTAFFLVFLALFALADRRELGLPFGTKMAAALLSLFSICLFFHGNLERDKPRKSDLTIFYLYLSLGGWLGGIFGGIAAPLIFSTTFELKLVFIASLYGMMLPHLMAGTRTFRNLVTAAMALFLALSYASQEILLERPTIRAARSFYGTYRVMDFERVPGKWAAAKLLVMGTTRHGGEERDAAGRLIPMAYYHERTGVGLAIRSRPDLKHVGVVGLGTGVLALYGKPGQTYDFYEIDPLVKNLAQTSFKNLAESRAKVRVILGDARLSLRSAPDRFYDILVLDAFTSGAVPTHLLTVEAMTEFSRKVKDDGLILVHISNRFVDLLPVLACDARSLGFLLAHHESPANDYFHLYGSHWAALAKKPEALMPLLRTDPSRWLPARTTPVCFTDDFSHLFSLIHL